MQEESVKRFDGVISGVTGFGLFVALDGIYVGGIGPYFRIAKRLFPFRSRQAHVAGRAHLPSAIV